MTRQEARTFRTAIGRRLKERRLALGMTQEALAWQGNVSQGAVSLYEQGKVEIPLGVLIDFCRALQVSPLCIVPDLRGYVAPETQAS